MDLKSQWYAVLALSYLLPILVTVAIVALPVPSRLFLRCGVAIAAGWFISVAFTVYFYNPVGYRYAASRGIEDAQMRFDNNSVASGLLGSWMLPALATIVALWIGRTIRRRRAQSGGV